MNIPALIPTDTLPTLIDSATSALENARTSAEVLEARDLARVAYDAAKSTARMHRAKQAHDSLIADVHRAQANALAIRARAEMRLAEEYDAAQERGEVAGIGGNRGNQFASVDNANAATAADLGLRRDEIHEARKLRDAEPHISYACVEQMKQMARRFLARNCDPESDENEIYGDQAAFEFSGKLQDRYPLPRKSGEEPAYKVRSLLTAEERAWNVAQLRKSADARNEHADALEAEGQMFGAA